MLGLLRHTWARGISSAHGQHIPCCPAEEFGAKLHLLSASSVFGAYMGESERRLRQVGGRPVHQYNVL